MKQRGSHIPELPARANSSPEFQAELDFPRPTFGYYFSWGMKAGTSCLSCICSATRLRSFPLKATVQSYEGIPGLFFPSRGAFRIFLSILFLTIPSSLLGLSSTAADPAEETFHNGTKIANPTFVRIALCTPAPSPMCVPLHSRRISSASPPLLLIHAVLQVWVTCPSDVPLTPPKAISHSCPLFPLPPKTAPHWA